MPETSVLLYIYIKYIHMNHQKYQQIIASFFSEVLINDIFSVLHKPV